MGGVFALYRPKHWAKNLFVFMPLFFGGAMTDVSLLLDSIVAFFAFSFAASAVYCYNDIIDVEADRRHSVKCHRPIASGRISVAMGAVLCALAALAALMVSCLVTGWATLLCIVAYLTMELFYCHWLKRIAIIDVVILASGFVLRILTGSAATGIVPSHWLVLMTFLLMLLLSLAKRRDDVLRMQQTGIPPRHNTKRYNLTFINQAVTVTASVTLVCYIMYTISPEVTSRANSQYMYLTTILVLLGLLRYMQRAAVDQNTGDPVKLLYRDHFLQAVVLLWVIAYAVVIYG